MLKCILRDLPAECTLNRFRDSLLCKCSYLGLLSIIKTLTVPPYQLAEVDLMGSWFLAVGMGYTDIVKHFIQHGPIRQSQIDTAVLRASESGHGEIVQTLIGLTSNNFVQENAASLFSHATFHCDIRTLRHLLDRYEDKTGMTGILVAPLQIACEYGYSTLVDLFLTTQGIEIDELSIDGKTALHLAAENGHPAVIHALLSHKAAVDLATSGELETPLHLASKYGHVEAVKLLLSHGANPNLKACDGRAALHFAGFGGCCAVTKALLDEKALINALDDGKESVLHIAIRKGHKRQFKLLLDYSDLHGKMEKPAEQVHPHGTDGIRPIRLDLDSVNTMGETPLMNALSNGLEEIALQLVESGADLETINNSGQTALTIASRKGYTAVVEALLARKVDPNVLVGESERPLHVASENGHDQIVRLLLDSGADVSTKDNTGNTPMYLACANGHIEIVQELLEEAPDLHNVDVAAWMPLNDVVKVGREELMRVLLHYAGADASNFFGVLLQKAVLVAAQIGEEGMLGLLLDAGADINFQDAFGNTALQLAAWCSHPRIVLLLLARRANLELRDGKGNTALSDAADRGSTAILKLLMDAGADKDAVNHLGLTPLLRAATADNDQSVRLLLDRGAKAISTDPNHDGVLQLSAAKYSTDVVKVLLDRGADINSISRSQGSVLQIAIDKNRKAMVEFLLEEKADIDQVCPSKGTALQFAVEKGNLEMIKILLDRGAKVNEGGGKLGSALHTMLRYWDEDGEMLKLLLDHGADVDQPDSQGRRPIHFAAYANNVRLVTSWKAQRRCKDRQGRVPLHFAAANGALSVFRYLLKLGEDCNVTDDDGWTPLHWACRQARPRVVEFLLDHKANLSVKDTRDGWTARDVAVFHDNIDALKRLTPPMVLSEVGEDDGGIVKSAGRMGGKECDSCFCVSLRWHFDRAQALML